MKNWARFSAMLVAMVLLSVASSPIVAGGGATVSVTAGQGPSSPEVYWTPERIEQAQPIPFYDESFDSPAAGSPAATPEGPPITVPSGVPADDQETTIVVDDQPQLDDAEEPFADFGTQDVFDDSFVNVAKPLWKQFPWRTIGKLLITSPTGGSGWCTASVISPNDIIVTAAHCCYDRGAQSWMRDWTFAPAMRDTTAPGGLFPAISAVVLTAWINEGGRKNDVCVLTMGRNQKGRRLSSLVGWLGRSWNYGEVQHHRAFGYPSNIESGKFKYECAAESYANCGDTNVLAQGCSMTNGSSGGPWIRQFRMFQSGAVNYVNGVVSGYDGCTGTYGKSFNAPRFTDQNIVPLCSAVGCD